MQDTKCPRCGAECPAIEWDSDFEAHIYECMYCANPTRWEGAIDGKFVANRQPNRQNFTWVWHNGKKTSIG